MKARPRAPTRKTEEALDHRQNNQSSVKAVSPCHCIASKLVYHTIAISTALQSSHKDNVHSTAAK